MGRDDQSQNHIIADLPVGDDGSACLCKSLSRDFKFLSREPVFSCNQLNPGYSVRMNIVGAVGNAGSAEMLTEIPAEQFSLTVEEVARAVLAEVEWFRPPVDMFEVADRLNMVIARDAAMGVRARFVKLSGKGRRGQGTIFVADDPRPERLQWAVAHEVGESIAHRVFVRLGIALVDIPPTGREQVANHLASCMLLPREWLNVDGQAVGWDLPELKQMYSTASHELIARRMLEMAPPCDRHDV